MTVKKKKLFDFAPLDFNKLILLFIALAQVGNSYVLFKTQQNVKMVETQTNHIKDQLVAATDSAARAEGKADGRAEQKLETEKPK